MNDRRLRLLPPLVALLVGVDGLHGAEPTPTPRPAAKRKLGGGRFGTPPSATPTPRPEGASSLADVVRKTQDQEAPEKRSHGIVITNETLRRSEKAPKSASITITGTADSAPTVRIPMTPTPSPGAIPEYKDASGRTESQWKERAATARSRVEKAEEDLAAGQAEVHRLENDFYAWSDGNYRERVIRPAWDQAKERLKALEAEAGVAREALSGLEEEARKSGTPPGWLR